MKFSEYITESEEKETALLEAVSKKWKQILANPTKVISAGYINNAGRLDLSWHGECNGCINYGMNKKGTLYKIKGEDWMFFTYFNDNKSLSVNYFSSDNELEFIEAIPLSTLTKMMIKAKAWKGKPIQINGKKTSKYVTFQKGKKYASQWEFVFEDGMTVTASVYKDDEPAVKKASILNKIKEIESWGYKIAKKVQPELERLLPDLFGDTDFELTSNVWLNANKIDKSAEFQKFINNMDNNSRTGHGIDFIKDGIQVHGMIGNTSSGFRSEIFKWNKKPETFTQFKKFLIDKGTIKYIKSLQKAMQGEMDAYMNYVKSGGVLD